MTQVDFDRIVLEEAPQAARIAQWMKDRHPAVRILDVGCGPGIYVEEMRRIGIEASGVDNDERLVESDYLKRFDITELNCRSEWEVDVVLSLEVGEHIPAELADAYVDFIIECDPEVIYFSAARPGQGGEGHINCQPKSYWIEKFHRLGYWLDPDATEEFIGFIRSGYHLGWLPQNICILRRG